MFNLDNKDILKYMSNAYWRPEYIPDYYPIWHLLRYDSYKEISNFFKILENKDRSTIEFDKYRQYKQKNLLKGVLSAPSILKLNKDPLALTKKIFQNSTNINYMLIKFVFLFFNKNDFLKRFNVINMNILEEIMKEGKGCILATHHWGGFQFIFLYLLASNLPVTLVMSDEMHETFNNIFDIDEYPNIRVRYINSQTNVNYTTSEKTLFNCMKDLKAGRIVFTCIDNPIINTNNFNKNNNFLGAKVRFTRFAAGLAKKAKCPIVHIYPKIDFNKQTIDLSLGGIINCDLIRKLNELEIMNISNSYMEKKLLQRPADWTYADWFYKYMLIEGNH
ncbi:hypothetical protein [Apilactobacillus micheneri]|uniref:LpxL/LpxP family acyltransferase n=1 Tax=Apilactobacillus micheneri TaxID=1899430 RepID=UPI000D515B64|nr:hypothetical protein [Apilactobacillus micheneri]GAY79777.1 hypothetical protein NBRC113063_00641 [Apilactobacillus micheneri]